MTIAKLTCPNCGKVTFNSPENKFRPFCCERCKMIDLGDWAEENHRIPGDEIGTAAADEEF